MLNNCRDAIYCVRSEFEQYSITHLKTGILPPCRTRNVLLPYCFYHSVHLFAVRTRGG